MRALIIGAGNAGSRLTRKLCAENYDVVVVDRDAGALEELEAELDIMTVQGHGADPEVLDEAQIEKCDVLAGVTNSDDTNILAGIMAKRAGTEYVVARIINSNHLDAREYANLSELGIDLAINPHEQCAMDIQNMLRLPGIIETAGLFGNLIMAAAIQIPADSPLIDVPLKDLSDEKLISKIRFISRIKDEELDIPFGESVFHDGDIVYAVGTRKDINDFLYWCRPGTAPADKVVIASGHKIGLALAKRMEDEADVYLIEHDPDCAQHCSDNLGKTTVMLGNMLSQEIYQEIGFTRNTAFVAASENDEDNIIACLLANKRSALYTTALIKEPEYVPIIDSLHLIDRTVSTHISLINSILQFIRGKNVMAAAELHTISGELLEIKIGDKSRWVGKKISEINMPKESIIATVLRGDTIHPAIGSLELKAQDRLAIFSTPKSVKKLRALCKG